MISHEIKWNIIKFNSMYPKRSSLISKYNKDKIVERIKKEYQLNESQIKETKKFINKLDKLFPRELNYALKTGDFEFFDKETKRGFKSFDSTEFEVALSVEDYIKEAKGDPDLAFDLAEEDEVGALKLAKEDFLEAMNLKKIPKQVSLEVEFEEFDSPNWTHAGAYFNVILTGPQEIIIKFNKAYEELWK